MDKKIPPKISLKISGEAAYKIKGQAALPVDVIINEISKDWIKFVTSKVLKPDALLELTINITSISEPIFAEGKVLWQRRLSTRFLLDTCVKFKKITNENSRKLVHYIYEHAKTSIASREHLRYPFVTEVKYSLLNSKEKIEQCESIDIGLKGMRLLLDKDMDLNSRLLLNFKLTDYGDSNLTLRARIVWDRAEPLHMIGVEFEDINKEDTEKIVNFIKTRKDSII